MNDPLGNFPDVGIVGEIERLRAENAKLRAAIKAVERAYMGNDPEARIKPWQHMIALANEQEGK